LRGLAVISRTQVFDAIKHLSGSVLERVHEGLAIDIGRRLGATVVVGGAYQRLGPRIRITAEAVDVRSGDIIRSVKVDGRVDDMFALQDRLVDELRQGLRVSLHVSGTASEARKETESLEAYEAFSRGMVHLRLATRESLDRAVVLFEQAIGADPRYASAWAMLGVTRNMQAQFLAQPALLDQALQALQHAIAIDPRHVYALAGLSSAQLGRGRSDEAIAAATRALDIDPDHVMARGVLARAFWIGKGLLDEGIAALERAGRQSPDAGYIHQQLALLFSLRGDLDRAEHEATRAVALQDALKSGTEGLLMVGSHVRFGYIRYRQGRYDEALAAFERERAFLAQHDHALKERLLIEIAQKRSASLWRKGDRAGADRAYEEAVNAFGARRSRGPTDPFTTYYLAALHALRGESDPALRLLAECLAALPALTRTRLRLDPDFDPVRDTDAFRALVGDSAAR
jgi:tetratricopeptide (TPR) repeat protein